jgi:hypothetical protein
LLQAPLLAPEVVRRTAERIELRSGAVLEITTNDHRLIRGRSAIAVLGDEVSFWRADGESSSSDEEVIAAAAPSLMTAPGGGYLVLSSTTYRKRGLMFDRYKEYYGKDAADELVWLAPSGKMNASLPAADIERELAADPVKNAAEYMSVWRDDISGFIPADALEAATDTGVIQRPPSLDYSTRYVAFADAAGGARAGGDSFTLAICRGGKDGMVYLDRLLEREPPFHPATTVAEFVEVLRSYRITHVTGDHFSGGWAASEFFGTSSSSGKHAAWFRDRHAPRFNSLDAPPSPRLPSQLSLRERIARSPRQRRFRLRERQASRLFSPARVWA